MKRIIKISIIALFVIMGGVLAVIRLPSPLFLHDYSTVVVDETGEYLRVFLNKQEQWIFPPDEDPVPDKLRQAVILFEDQRYEHHWGVDFMALGRAVIQNIRNGETVSGASTITMQVARLSRPKDRNIVNKLFEMIQAFKLEYHYSKDEILQMYLTHAPYGGNIVGYKAAALRYFGKPAHQITWGEAATLAVLPNNPGAVNPMQGWERLKEKRDRLLKRLYEEEIIDAMTYQLARDEAVPTEQISFELRAPHLAERLAHHSEEKLIQTTISKKLQERVGQIVGEYMEMMEQRGIFNCAVLLADTRTGTVKAYIGSPDYFDQEHGGMIDGVFMTRSTGSILKPFLYGLAMDQGLIVPESKLQDIPVTYGAYTPYNANDQFQGVVTAREALTTSLNAPAVSLLNEYGVEPFYDFLQEAGVDSLTRTPKEYGLPLILGGAEVSLWDVTAMYYSLGNEGVFRDLHVLQDEVLAPGQHLISPGASYLVVDMLQDVKRPGLEHFWQEFGASWRIAWKTGTSYGNRDAWAVGVSPDWTIGVWVGNFDGRENTLLSGIEAAAPLLFRIFNALDKDHYQPWFNKPDDLKEIRVSAETGYPLQEEDGQMVSVLAPASGVPLRFSPYEKYIFLNGDGTEEVCSLCWETGDVQKVLRVIYPPQVIEYLKEQGQKAYTVPPHRTSCPTLSNRNPIRMIYPQEGSVLLIPRGLDGEYQKVTFKIAHSQAESKLFWYLDQKYVGETKNSHQKSMTLDPGWHQLHVVDGEGHQQTIKFYVDRKK